MRIEITYKHGVHTSEGKVPSAVRVTLPAAEAEQIIANGHAKKVRARALFAGPEPGPEAVELPERTSDEA